MALLLEARRTVRIQAAGDALSPVVLHGQEATFEPVVDPWTLRLGDIVFAQVLPEGRYYGLKIHYIDTHYWRLRDMRDPCITECWTQPRHILGRLVCTPVQSRLHQPMTV